jgi:hypothetical protein
VNELTLQINLSPGDLAYAELTVPALLAAHPEAGERLLIVDVCKPQRTKIVDPARRFPEPAFSARVEKITALAERWRATGQVERVVVLRPGDPLFPKLSRHYLRPWVRETHDYGGCALMAYLAAFELCRTRWLLHYDADMLIHQADGFAWAPGAIAAMADSPRIVAASPRPAPPRLNLDAPTAEERLAAKPHAAGWLNTWFSTRCYLFDLTRLRPLLPLLQGRIFWEVLAARLLKRGYPRSPEIMLFRRMQSARQWRLTLRDSRAWLLHPIKKDSEFVAALPRLLHAVKTGHVPTAQRGHANLDLAAWQAQFAASANGD